MTKTLLCVVLALALSSCNVVVNAVQPRFPAGSNGSQTAIGWDVVLDSSIKGATIGSSEPITNFKSTAPCQYRATAAGTNFNLVCNAPNNVVLEAPPKTEIQVRVLSTAPINL